MKRTLLNKDFTEQVETILVPYFREQGFIQQSIDNYQRSIKPFIHCINLQERSDRQALCVNMGVHLDFLTVPAKLEIPPVKEIKEIECAIRCRLGYKGQSVEWWPAKRAKRQVKSIKALFQKEGIAFFDRYTSFPDVFESITLEDIKSSNASVILPGMTYVRMALFLARVNEYIGRSEKAKHFAEYGLDNIGRAKGLVKSFEEIIYCNKSL